MHVERSATDVATRANYSDSVLSPSILSTGAQALDVSFSDDGCRVLCSLLPPSPPPPPPPPLSAETKFGPFGKLLVESPVVDHIVGGSRDVCHALESLQSLINRRRRDKKNGQRQQIGITYG